jgi:hypothetical protein
LVAGFQVIMSGRFWVFTEVLEAALRGFEHTLGEVTSKITEIKQALGSRHAADGRSSGRQRRHMSAASRAKIAAAQRKRWAAQKKQKGQTTAPAKQFPPKKRKISADARKRMADATRKRWAEFRAKKAKAAKT